MSFLKKIITGGKFTVYDAFNFYAIKFFARNAELYLNTSGTKEILSLLWMGISKKHFKMP